MDSYPYLEHWLKEEAQGATALLGLLFLVGLFLAGYVWLARSYPAQLVRFRRCSFVLFCACSIVFMLVMNG